jgi:hypothetical protein
MMAHFEYFYYPFDVQTIQIMFEVPGADLFTCEGMNPMRHWLNSSVASLRALERTLLPGNAAWSLAGTRKSSMHFEHPIGANGLLQRSKCVLNIKVKRNSEVFVLKFYVHYDHRCPWESCRRNVDEPRRVDW